jgi:phosphate:Na+ symporter
MGIQFLKDSVPDTNANPQMFEWITNLTDFGFASVLIFLVIGFVLTLIVQSSSVAMAVTMTAAAKGWIGFEYCAAIIMGENIGTTITAILAASTGNSNAKRAAMAHLCFNMIGVVWILIVFYPFTAMVSSIVDNVYADKIAAALADGANPATIGLHYKLSLFHTMFNLCNIVLLIGFVPQFEKLVTWIIKPNAKEKNQSSTERLEYLATHFADIGELCLFEGQKEVVHLAEISTKMFDGFTDLFQKPDTDLSEMVNELRSLEDESDKLSYALTNFFVQCTAHELSEASTSMVVKNMIIIAELEDMSDCCYRLITMARKRYRKQFKYQMLQSPAFVGFCNEMDHFLLYAHRMLLQQHITQADLDNAFKIRTMLDKTRKSIRREVITAIEEGGSTARGGILFIEILGQCEKVGAHAMNILEALQNPAQLFEGSHKKLI